MAYDVSFGHGFELKLYSTVVSFTEHAEDGIDCNQTALHWKEPANDDVKDHFDCRCVDDELNLLRRDDNTCRREKILLNPCYSSTVIGP